MIEEFDVIQKIKELERKQNEIIEILNQRFRLTIKKHEERIKPKWEREGFTDKESWKRVKREGKK